MKPLIVFDKSPGFYIKIHFFGVNAESLHPSSCCAVRVSACIHSCLNMVVGFVCI